MRRRRECGRRSIRHVQYLPFHRFLSQESVDNSRCSSFSLKTLFLPVTSGSHFRETVRAFPRLEDLRLWTTVAALRPPVTADDLPRLHSLLLGGLHSGRVLADLVSAVGARLTALKLETVLTDVPLRLLGEGCPALEELQVTNCRLVVGGGGGGGGRRHHHHDCDSTAAADFLSRLKLVHLFLVQYVGREEEMREMQNRDEREEDDEEEEEQREEDEHQTIPDDRGGTGCGYRPKSALHCILRHSRRLEGLQATGCPSFDDASLKEVLAVNPLSRLRRFIMTDAASALQRPPEEDEPGGTTAGTALALTAESALRLFDCCPALQCVGDLRRWDMSPGERRRVAVEVQRRTGLKWIATPGN